MKSRMNGLLAFTLLLWLGPVSRTDAGIFDQPWNAFKPDLIPSYTVTWLADGRFYVVIRVENRGLRTARSSQLYAWFFNRDTSQYVETGFHYTPSLDPGEHWTYVVILPPSQDLYFLGITADIYNQVSEMDESNNTIGTQNTIHK